MIGEDIEAGRASSLILEVRTLRGRFAPFTNDTDHNDLATGAFMNYDRERINCGKAPLKIVDSVPEREANTYVGGNRGTFLVPVWEEPID